MKKVTVEVLAEKIHELELCKAWGTISINGEFNLEVYKMLLATMEAEPVAWIVQNKNTGEVEIDEPFAKATNPKYWTDSFPVYRHAQPEPVVPEALEHLRSIVADPRLLPRRKEWISGQQYSYVLLEEVEAIVDDACRAAVLNRK